MLKAIETRYKGYRFRSRLEARWAVFFDALGFDWKYEAEGFEAGGRAYLPDFELRSPSGRKTFIEVKGDPDGIAANRYECQRYADFVSTCGSEMVLLGDIPSPGVATAFHPMISWEDGLLERKWVFFGFKNAPFGRAVHSAINELCGIPPLFGKDACNPDLWVVDTKVISLPKYPHLASAAYEKARAARFEHGESGAAK